MTPCANGVRLWSGAANELLVVTPPLPAPPTTHTWDAAGNLHVENCGGALTTYTWDDENKLVGVQHPDGRIETFAYDPVSGLRRKKETPEAGRIFVWQGQNVLVETDLDLVVQAEYTDLPGMWGGLVSQRRGEMGVGTAGARKLIAVISLQWVSRGSALGTMCYPSASMEGMVADSGDPGSQRAASTLLATRVTYATHVGTINAFPRGAPTWSTPFPCAFPATTTGAASCR